MKTKTLALILITAALTQPASATEYFSADQKIESKLCAISANEGFSAARKVASQHGIFLSRFSKSLLCNGNDIRDIAKNIDNEPQAIKQIEVFAKNNEQETALCIAAIKQGLASVKEKIRNLNLLKCNGEKVTDFVKRYHNTAI